MTTYDFVLFREATGSVIMWFGAQVEIGSVDIFETVSQMVGGGFKCLSWREVR